MRAVRLTTVAALTLVAALCAVHCGQANSYRPPEDPAALTPAELLGEFLQEFEGAFPVDAPRSTGVKEWTIVAAPAEVQIFDGRKLKVWCYNGQVPGPTLRIRFGQTVRVVLHNRLPQPTTIHWHGVRVPNAMDGVPEVTQPPVLPGESFVYEFTPKDPGTYWFHPHVRSSEQVERGLYGVLIVEDAEPLPYTTDAMWILDDWRLTPRGDEIDPNFNTRNDLAHDGRWGNVIAVNGSLSEELAVDAGERIRLRILNSANGRVFKPDFSRLDARVIAVDGNYVEEPFAFENFEIAPGNRVDLDIALSAEDAGRLVPIFDRFRTKPNRLATIRVRDDVVKTPEFASPARAYVPHWNGHELLEPTLQYKLNVRTGGKYGIEWTMNDKIYAAHDRPNSLILDEWAKIRFTNESPRLHPMHIHGMFFKLLTRNGKPVDERFWRDTVLTHSRETVEIGLVPLDPGSWLAHCHILEHAAAGMMTIIEVQKGDRSILRGVK